MSSLQIWTHSLFDSGFFYKVLGIGPFLRRVCDCLIVSLLKSYSVLGAGDLEKAILTFVIFYCFEFLACIHFSFCYFGQHLAMSTMLVTLHL